MFCRIGECWFDPLDLRWCDVVSWVIVREPLRGVEAEVVIVLGIHRVCCTERVCDDHGRWVIDLLQICASSCFTGVLTRVFPAGVGRLMC